MTGEFSRRSFLKYTALTAVAVAGSSLLSGCEYGYNPVQHAPGTSNVVLKVRTTLDMVEYDEESNTTLFRLVVTNGRKNALRSGCRVAYCAQFGLSRPSTNTKANCVKVCKFTWTTPRTTTMNSAHGD